MNEAIRMCDGTHDGPGTAKSTRRRWGVPRYLLSILLIAVVTVGVSATGQAERTGQGAESTTDDGAAVGESGGNASVTPGAPPELSIAALRGPTGIGVAPLLADLESDGTVPGTQGRYALEIVPDPGVMVARLSSGEAHIGMLPTNVAAQLYSRDVPVQVAAVTLWGLLYVVGTDDAIGSWEDLAGRTVQSIARGATPDILLRHILSEKGLDAEADVTLDYRFAPVELAQLTAAGEVDLAVLPEPFVTQVLSRRDDLSILLDFQAAWTDLYGDAYPQTVIVVRRDAAEQYPDAVAEALALIEAGWTTVTENPDEAGRMVADSPLGLPGPVVAAALPRFNARYVPMSRARQAVERYLSILADFDPRTVGGSLPDDRFYFDER